MSPGRKRDLTRQPTGFGSAQCRYVSTAAGGGVVPFKWISHKHQKNLNFGALKKKNKKPQPINNTPTTMESVWWMVKAPKQASKWTLSCDCSKVL